MAKKDVVWMNEKIRADKVRLVDENGEQKGIVPFNVALTMAKEKELDLVAIAPQSVPVVCKLMDYSRFKFERDKKKKKSRKINRSGQMKEMRMGPLIGKHDLDTKNRHIREFITEGYTVKVTVFFRGRQMAHMDIGYNVLLAVVEEFKDIAVSDQKPKREGNRMNIILRPNK